MNLKWMRIPAAAYNGFFRIAGGCRSGRNHLFVLLFRDIEQVEAVVRYRSDAVVFHGDRTGQGVVCLLYTSPSPRDVEEARMPSSA